MLRPVYNRTAHMSKVGPKTALFYIQLVLWTICCHMSKVGPKTALFSIQLVLWTIWCHITEVGPKIALFYIQLVLWTIWCHTSKVGPKNALFAKGGKYQGALGPFLSERGPSGPFIKRGHSL